MPKAHLTAVKTLGSQPHVDQDSVWSVEREDTGDGNSYLYLTGVHLLSRMGPFVQSNAQPLGTHR